MFGIHSPFAKETHTPVLLIGHINKEGSIAGPKVLEHIVMPYFSLKAISIICIVSCEA